VAELKQWSELPAGGRIAAATAPHPRTGAWRTGEKPSVALSGCVNCLLCWLYCPDSAVVLDGERFAGFDYDVCKGCSLCEEVCPVDAIAMVAEETRLPERGLLP
jgi:2-oxoacid:acceptor oxidoreductase delta subunit (pyruvate/2-ketoisovalerate family)